MNDMILPELKCVVEQAVRPVWATMARKRRMREELLNHLIAIFEEEAATLGNDQAALEEAKRRFGDPGELTGQLQQAVPRWDRCRSILENLGYRPDESAWHLAARHFVVTLLIYSTAALLWLSIMFACGPLRNLGPVESRHMMGVALLLGLPTIALLNVIFSIFLAFLLNKIAPALTRTRRGRFLLAVLCVLAVWFGLVVAGLAGGAVLFVLMARQAVGGWRYRADWA